METQDTNELGAKPLRDRLEDIEAAISCLASALVRSGAVTEQQIREEALDLLRFIKGPDDLKEKLLPVTVGLSRLSVPKLGQPVPQPAEK